MKFSLPTSEKEVIISCPDVDPSRMGSVDKDCFVGFLSKTGALNYLLSKCDQSYNVIHAEFFEDNLGSRIEFNISLGDNPNELRHFALPLFGGFFAPNSDIDALLNDHNIYTRAIVDIFIKELGHDPLVGLKDLVIHPCIYSSQIDRVHDDTFELDEVRFSVLFESDEFLPFTELSDKLLLSQENNPGLIARNYFLAFGLALYEIEKEYCFTPVLNHLALKLREGINRSLYFVNENSSDFEVIAWDFYSHLKAFGVDYSCHPNDFRIHDVYSKFFNRINSDILDQFCLDNMISKYYSLDPDCDRAVFSSKAITLKNVRISPLH